MKILLATNALKGSLSSTKVAETIQQALLNTDKTINTIISPVADGGDGTLEAISYCTPITKKTSNISGPLGQPVLAEWLLIEDNPKTAIIEALQANGLILLKPEEYNPLLTTTFGVGEIIREALDNNCEKIILTIGGSSTNDAGAGILQALGIKLLDSNNQELKHGGEALLNLEKIELTDIDARLKSTKLIVACDVKNPLCGNNGASYVYGPQKGASRKDVELLDKSLSHFADITQKTIQNDFRDFSGTGAGGGIAFALKSFFDAEITSGFDLISDITNLEEKIKLADIVITSEGRLDSQSLSGKATYKMAQLCKKYDKKIIVIAGSLERNLNLKLFNIDAALSLADGPIDLEDSIQNSEYLLYNLTQQIINLIKIGQTLH